MFETISGAVGFFLLFVLTACLVLIYQCILPYWFYFSDRNVKFVRGIPLLGTAYKSILGIEPAAISYRRCYEFFPTERFVGTYNFGGGRPSYMIRDPDLIKQLLVTDFHHFSNHKLTSLDQSDLFTHNLFGVQTLKWPKTRFNLSSIFSDSKMRQIHAMMVDSSEHFMKALKETDKISKMFYSRDLFSRYTSDIIASAAFGIEINSMRDRKNAFFNASYSLSKYRYIDSLKFLASFSLPSLVKLMDIMGTENQNVDLIKKIVKETVDTRKKENVLKNNVIDFMIKAKNGQLQGDQEEDRIDIGFAATPELTAVKSEENVQNLTDDDMVAQCIMFFLGGLSSASGIACFLFHELAVNPDIQNKLFGEIDHINKELNGSPLTYDMIPKLKYLDMVVCETLRRWCPIPYFERTCKRPYVLETRNNTKVELQIGDGVLVPAYALHMDEKYFAKPIKFDPERFNDENRDFIRTGTYLPFGIGPQNCAESRFALLTIKTLVFHFLSEFYIDKSYKTQDPLKLKALPMAMDAEGGFFIELRRRHPDCTPYKSQVFT